jgi:hypothetical protein
VRVLCTGCMCANLEPRHRELRPVRSTEERIIMLANNDNVQGGHAGIHQLPTTQRLIIRASFCDICICIRSTVVHFIGDYAGYILILISLVIRLLHWCSLPRI